MSSLCYDYMKTDVPKLIQVSFVQIQPILLYIAHDYNNKKKSELSNNLVKSSSKRGTMCV